MKRALSVTACILLAGCNSGVQTTATIDARGAQAERIDQVVTVNANPTTSIPVNIALDPTAFSSIFGLGVKSVTNPNAEQVKALSDLASKPGSAVTPSQAQQCTAEPAKCTVKSN